MKFPAIRFDYIKLEEKPMASKCESCGIASLRRGEKSCILWNCRGAGRLIGRAPRFLIIIHEYHLFRPHQRGVD